MILLRSLHNMTMVPVSLLVRKDAIDSENVACKMPAFKCNSKEWSHFKVEYMSGLVSGSQMKKADRTQKN